jgi:hypothetical protein
MLDVHMGRNFGGSIGSLMGFNVISPQFTGLIDTVMNFTGDIGDKMAGFNGDIGRIMSAIDTIQQLARALELPMPSALIMGAVAALEAAQGVADQLMGALQSAMNAAIQPLIGQVMDQVMGPTAEIDCDNIAMLWNGNGQEGVVPLQGGGARPGVPFMSVASMISGAALNGNSDYMSQLQSGQNMDILNRAMNNLTQGGLSRPGILPSWRPAPSFGRNASTDEIIEQMRMQN